MGKRSRQQGGLVYSTAAGRMCPGCRRPMADCVCRDRSRQTRAAADGVVRVSRQSKGRKGAGVTLITGAPGNAVQLAALAKTLKSLCGVGGSLKDGVIELQGDQRERVRAELERQGMTVRLAGG
jgi:translation initiation factor 1